MNVIINLLEMKVKNEKKIKEILKTLKTLIYISNNKEMDTLLNAQLILELLSSLVILKRKIVSIETNINNYFKKHIAKLIFVFIILQSLGINPYKNISLCIYILNLLIAKEQNEAYLKTLNMPKKLYNAIIEDYSYIVNELSKPKPEYKLKKISSGKRYTHKTTFVNRLKCIALKSTKYAEMLKKTIFDVIRSNDFLNDYKLKSTDFTRDRKLSMDNVVQMIVIGISKTLTATIEDFYKLQGTTYVKKYGEKNEPASKVALSKARAKIDYKLFKNLCDKFINEYYKINNDNISNIQLYRNKFLLIDIDGSAIEVPNIQLFKDIFGQTESQKGARKVARAAASCWFDPLNNMIILTDPNKYPQNERDSLKKQVNEFKKIKSLKGYLPLLIMDRGYYSYDLAAFLLSEGFNFLFRLKKDHLQKYIANMKTDDEFLEISTKDIVNGTKEVETINWLKAQGETIKLRCTKIKLGEGNIELLLSNFSKEDVPYEEMKALYFKRWRDRRKL